MKKSKWLTVLLAIASALTLLTFSIAVPIMWRPFYYMQIEPLNLPENTGYTEDEIKPAFDEVLDYCIGANDEFSVGVLEWSESGKSHFTDCRVLFLLDLRLLVVGAVAVIILLVLSRVLHRRCAPILKRGPCFWAGAGLGVVFLVIGGYAALDFDRFFTVFHMIFFPGKDNWIFDPNTDPVINLLPETFFLNCAVLIFAILIVGCVLFFIGDFLVFSEKSPLKKWKS